jgi:hypothetical protein
MWLITKTGFVSLVQHDTDSSKIRARARRREHLADTFDLFDADIIDLGPDAPDYRWHADVPRSHVAQAMYDSVMDLDYTSHVKEAVAGDDDVMYTAMLGCWRALYQLQDQAAPDRPGWLNLNDVTPESLTAWAEAARERARYFWKNGVRYDREPDPPADAPPVEGDIAGHANRLAYKMLDAGRPTVDVDGDDWLNGPDHDDDWPPSTPLLLGRWDSAVDDCAICGHDLQTGDYYVTLPETLFKGEVLEPKAPAHDTCAEDEGWTVIR